MILLSSSTSGFSKSSTVTLLDFSLVGPNLEMKVWSHSRPPFRFSSRGVSGGSGVSADGERKKGASIGAPLVENLVMRNKGRYYDAPCRRIGGDGMGTRRERTPQGPGLFGPFSPPVADAFHPVQ